MPANPLDLDELERQIGEHGQYEANYTSALRRREIRHLLALVRAADQLTSHLSIAYANVPFGPTRRLLDAYDALRRAGGEAR